MYTTFTAPFATRDAGLPRSMFLLLAGTLLFAACGSRAHAGDVYIACSAGVTLSMTDIRDVFLGEKQFAGPVKLLPVDNGAAQAEVVEFLKHTPGGCGYLGAAPPAGLTLIGKL